LGKPWAKLPLGGGTPKKHGMNEIVIKSALVSKIATTGIAAVVVDGEGESITCRLAQH